MHPLISTGGLAEVAYALPRALAAQGHDVRVALPCYQRIPAEHQGKPHCMCMAQLGGKTSHGAMRQSKVPGTEIPLYLIEHDGYFNRPELYGEDGGAYPDNLERFCFFSQAVLDGIPQTGWMPDVVHCHDWQTAALVVYLKTQWRDTPPWRGVPVVFTIHNLAYQGRFDAVQYGITGFPPELFDGGCLEYYGDVNLMKGALTLADWLTTVSPRYAREIQTPGYGAGLEGVLQSRRAQLSGILNGVDYGVWNPANDPHIAATYDKDDLTGKAACKSALQQRFGLPESDKPLFGMVSRLAWQKGVDLLVTAMEDMLGLDVQIVVLGKGDPEFEQRLLDLAERYPEKLGVTLAFNTALSHEVQAGSDFLLMPSRYEPCGLSQLFSLAYGCIPVVRRTGGLADTVRNISPVHLRRGDATGISFIPMTHQALTRAVKSAVELYAKPEQFDAVRANGMAEDFSWDRSCTDYTALYRQALDGS